MQIYITDLRRKSHLMLTVEKRATQPPVQDLANVCIDGGNIGIGAFLIRGSKGCACD